MFCLRTLPQLSFAWLNESGKYQVVINNTSQTMAIPDDTVTKEK